MLSFGMPEAQMVSMADLARANLEISMFNRAAEHAGQGDLDLAVQELDRLLDPAALTEGGIKH